MKYTVHRALSLIKSTKSRIEKEFSEDAPAWIRVARGQEDSIRGVSVEEIRREIQSHYDRVTALIENYIALKSAVVQSNAGVLPGTEPVEVPALVGSKLKSKLVTWCKPVSSFQTAKLGWAVCASNRSFSVSSARTV